MNPKPPSAQETLQLIESFTASIGSFAEREGRIDYAETLAASNLRQLEAEAQTQIETEAAQKRVELQQQVLVSKNELDTIYHNRREQIATAQLKVRKDTLEGIQLAEGKQKHDLQMQVIASAKRKDQNITSALHEYQTQKAPLHESEEKFAVTRNDAVKAFGGFPNAKKKLQASLVGKGPKGETFPSDLAEAYKQTEKAWSKTKQIPALSLYRFLPIWVQVILTAIVGGVGFLMIPKLEASWLTANLVLIVTGALIVIEVILYLISLGIVTGAAGRLAKCFRYTYHAGNQFYGQIESTYNQKKLQAEQEHQSAEEAFRTGLQSTAAAANTQRLKAAELIQQKAERVSNRLDLWKANQTERIDSSETEKLVTIGNQLPGLSGASTGPNGEDFETQRAALLSDWQNQSVKQIQSLSTAAAGFDSDAYWINQTPDVWEVPAAFPEEVVFGMMNYQFSESGARLPKDAALQLEQGDFMVPMKLLFPTNGSIFIETKTSESRDQAIGCLNQIVGALLANSPPGRVSFSLVDPVGLGESFVGLMHLSDYDEHLVNKRVNTQVNQIENRLGELCEHMEKVIQMYLRNEYETISEYNHAAGTTAERYHFLVVADFPQQFSDEAARRLLSIVQSGARCGVFTLIHYARRADLPTGFMIDDFRQSSVCLKSTPEGFVIGIEAIPGTSLQLLGPPENQNFLQWVHRFGEANRDSNRITVPFSTITPEGDEFWSLESAEELKVPIGRTGATKFQELAIGKGTCQHALIAGKTGSGKSTLFHVMITNMAMWFDPDQVEFYLIDFKKGVEFKAYATLKLPHARVIAIESDREFGLSVLQKLDEELKERGEKFRALGAQDIAGYKRAGGTDAMPRTLLLIDEFQEFFIEDDQISQQAAVLLDRIVRQGRAFGVHAILGSQTLGGAFTLARATLGQMVIRIALMCNESDAYLIMDDSNPAPRLLTRPGEGIYNDQAGNADANSPFQVVWLDDNDRNKCLTMAAEQAAARGMDNKPRVVFEGNAPALIAEDRYISNLLESGEFGGAPRLFLGAPNSIKTPTEAIFERQSGANLMIVGQRDDVVEGMLLIGLRLLIEQMAEKGRFYVIDGQLTDPNSQSWLKDTIGWLGDSVVCPAAHEIGETINTLAAEMKGKADGSIPNDDSTTFIVILGLQKYKKLRYEEDFSFTVDEDAEAKPSESLNDLITEGPSFGFHSIVSIDTYNNVNRSISRKAVSEFEKKVLFQMSAGDSASLIDTSKASDLGLNRAIYYNEPTGIAETFRPYAKPEQSWFG